MTLLDTSVWIQVFRQHNPVDLESVVPFEKIVVCLCSVSNFGKGRTLALLTDSAWNWGFAGADDGRGRSARGEETPAKATGDDGRALQRFWEGTPSIRPARQVRVGNLRTVAIWSHPLLLFLAVGLLASERKTQRKWHCQTPLPDRVDMTLGLATAAAPIIPCQPPRLPTRGVHLSALRRETRCQGLGSGSSSPCLLARASRPPIVRSPPHQPRPEALYFGYGPAAAPLTFMERFLAQTAVFA